MKTDLKNGPCGSYGFKSPIQKDGMMVIMT